MTIKWELISVEAAKQHPLYGEGGWLTVFAFSLVAGFLGDFGAINGEALKIGMSARQFLSYDLPSILFIKIALAIGLLKAGVIYTLLRMKHPKFRVASMSILVGYFPILLLVGFFTPFPTMGQFFALTLLSWITSCAIWITYLQRSQRVRVTFEHTVKSSRGKSGELGIVAGLFKVKDRFAVSANIDAVYEKIDQELKTDNVDRPTWTRAEGDAEGNAERARALYIKYRAQRLLAEKGDVPPAMTANIRKAGSKFNSIFGILIVFFLGGAVVAVMSLMFFDGSSERAKSGNSPSEPVDWSQFTPINPDIKPERSNRGSTGTGKLEPWEKNWSLEQVGQIEGMLAADKKRELLKRINAVEIPTYNMALKELIGFQPFDMEANYLSGEKFVAMQMSNAWWVVDNALYVYIENPHRENIFIVKFRVAKSEDCSPDRRGGHYLDLVFDTKMPPIASAIYAGRLPFDFKKIIGSGRRCGSVESVTMGKIVSQKGRGVDLEVTKDQARKWDEYHKSERGKNLGKFTQAGSDAEKAVRFGLSTEEYQRRYARSSTLCVTPEGSDFYVCRADVISGLLK